MNSYFIFAFFLMFISSFVYTEVYRIDIPITISKYTATTTLAQYPCPSMDIDLCTKNFIEEHGVYSGTTTFKFDCGDLEESPNGGCRIPVDNIGEPLIQRMLFDPIFNNDHSFYE